MPIESPYMSDLNKDVMRRVWRAYFVRRLLASEKFKAAVLASCCVSAVFLVSIPHIVANVARLPGVEESAAYLLAAFMHTSFVVESIVVVALGAGVLLVWDIGRNVGSVGGSFIMRVRERSRV